MVEPGNRVRVGDGQRGGIEVERMSHCVLSSVFSKAHTSSFLLLSAWPHVISPGKHCSLSALLCFCGAPFPGGPPGSLLPSPSAVTYHLLCGLLPPTPSIYTCSLLSASTRIPFPCFISLQSSYCVILFLCQSPALEHRLQEAGFCLFYTVRFSSTRTSCDPVVPST